MLTQEQISAIEHTESSLLLIAGPGSGKTKTIIEKILHLLKIKKISESSQILAITFTQKAALEMQERIEKEIENNPSLSNQFHNITISTIHSFALEIIEEYSHHLSLPKEYVLLEDHHQTLAFIEILERYSCKTLTYKDPISFAKELQSFFSKSKELGYTLENFQTLNFDDINTKIELFSLFAEYEKYKKEKNALDYADILIFAKKILEDKKNQKEISSRFEHIFVDEFQDTNSLQLSILSSLSKGTIFTCVGDEKQSIYGFRGSITDMKKEFLSIFPKGEIKYLTKNFRSNSELVSFSNRIVPKIASEKEIMVAYDILKSSTSSQPKITITKTKNEFAQLANIVEEIQDYLQENPNATIGILARRKVELEHIAKALDFCTITYSSEGLEKLSSHKLIQHILIQLECINAPKETNPQWVYLLEEETLLSKETIVSLSRKASFNEKSLWNVLEKESSLKNVSEFEQKELEYFVKKYRYCIDLKSSKLSKKELVLHYIEETKVLSHHITKKDARILEQFIRFISSLEELYPQSSFSYFLKLLQVSVSFLFFENQDENPDNLLQKNKVQLLTIHQSKGKEFDVVVLPFLNQRKFPTSLKKLSFENPFQISKEEHLLEELRLYYVAITRAKKELKISYVNQFSENKLPAKPSEFISDLDQNSFKQYDRELSFISEQNSIRTISSKTSSLEINLIKEIQMLLHSRQYDKAREQLNKLEKCFSKQTTLHAFDSKSKDKNLQSISLKQNNFSYDFSNHVYSISQIKTYQTCPKQYEFSYVYKIPTSSKHYFDFGTSLHSVLEKIKPEIDKGLSKEKAELRALSLLSSEWISKSYVSAEQEKEYFEKGIQAIHNFIETEYELKEKNKEQVNEGLEEKFVITIEDKKIMGFIDRIDKIGEEYMILDYKTSNSKESKQDLKKNIQLYCYALALKELKGVYPKSMGLWYLVHNSIETVEFEENRLKEFKEELLKEIKNIESQNFQPKPSYFACTFCDFSNICSYSKKHD
jgi:DNA helicase-2/ATP-dependent DNA helicase PcrA